MKIKRGKFPLFSLARARAQGVKPVNKTKTPRARALESVKFLRLNAESALNRYPYIPNSLLFYSPWRTYNSEIPWRLRNLKIIPVKAIQYEIDLSPWV